jgi:hypothetical protein
MVDLDAVIEGNFGCAKTMATAFAVAIVFAA